jgi:glucokinase
MILAGDIGGTKTNLAFFEAATGPPVAAGTFSSGEHSSLGVIVRRFVTEHSLHIEQACFGIAGPIKNGRCVTTNLPWIVDAQELASELGIESVSLINDLEANAHGIDALQQQDFVVLQPGAPDVTANTAIISAGTGLGEAGLFWDGKRHCPFACEGGHTDFAPGNDLEAELLAWLRTQWTHVSWERVLSGPGLHNIYRFLRDTGRGDEPAWLSEEMQEHDPAAAISLAALEGRSGLCEQALELFVSLYGAEAGNLALKLMATGGLFVGGGIAPKILEKMKDGTFIKAFCDKGRMKPLLEAMLVSVILNDKSALFGAARYAAMRSEETRP